MKRREENIDSRTVMVLLTKYSDWTSSFLYYISGRGYTHVSISLDGGHSYYSFNYKGFCMETIEKHRRRGVSKSISYEITVSQETYQRMYEQLSYFIEHKNELYYTRLGVVLCLLKIPFRWKNHFFCSQFVAHLLKDANEIPLSRPTMLYLPNHFRKELESSPFLKEMRYNVV